MRIYITLPGNFPASREKLRATLHATLTKYYGQFQASDIEFFTGDSASVCVMESAKRPGHDSEITSAITEIFACHVEVRLNYQRLNPEYRPQNLPSSAKPKNDSRDEPSEFDYEKLSLNYHAEEPHYTFEQVILPEDTRRKILEAVATIQVEEKVFDEWGLRSIIPYAVSAMSFYGAPGTGKTMAAEAVASMLGKKIIRAAYADIESKYHGEGPKMVKAIFLAAEREDAVLFLDESDSLLSKRLTDVRSGSEQAINSMRSQLLISLERFRGIVIFATNLVVNYDRAFLSRLISIEFPQPDVEARRAIWERHIRGNGLRIPLSDDVNTSELAEKYDTFCGREIKNAVKDACVTCAVNGRETVTQSDLLRASEKVKTEAEKVQNASDHTQSTLKGLLQKKVDGRRASQHSGMSFWRYKYRPRYSATRKASQQ